MQGAIEIQGVTKLFGAKRAVDSLDLRVERGQICGFIGPNGAGKTTTIRMILSILQPDAGTIAVLGKPSAAESKDRIGYLPEERGVYRKMKVGAFLSYMARLKGASSTGLEARIRGWLERLGLPDAARKRCEELSKGMQQKVQFLAAVIHEPDLLVLDEPFSGLDPVATRLLRGLVLEQRSLGRTVVFSTHVMQQAEQLCDHLFMIHQGKKVLDGRLADLQERYAPRTILVEPLDGQRGVDGLRGVAGVRMLSEKAASGGDDARATVHYAHLEETADPTAVMREIVVRVPVRRVEIVRPTLEEIFLGLVENPSGSRESPDA